VDFIKAHHTGGTMSGFLSKLFGGGSKADAATAGEREVYNGFEIEARPKAGGGSYNVAGVIRREGEPDGPAHEFIRADTFPNVEDAIRFSVIKAKRAEGRQDVHRQTL
jgi:hypothetical protein